MFKKNTKQNKPTVPKAEDLGNKLLDSLRGSTEALSNEELTSIVKELIIGYTILSLELSVMKDRMDKRETKKKEPMEGYG